MDIIINQMNGKEAGEITSWVYPEPYALYSMDGSDDYIDELLNDTYFSVSNNEGNLLGYYCFGESARVPTGNQFGVYNDNNITDIGLGMNPEFCGKGLGFDFLSSGLTFARNKFSSVVFRLTVASFNKRAIKVYNKIGFRKINSFERIFKNGMTEFWVMTLR